MSHKSNTSAEPAKLPVRQRVRPTTAGLQQSVDQPPDPVTQPASAIEDDDYKVGYCKPPRQSQFKPGFDPRRPKGRKKGSKNTANSIIGMMESPTMVRTPDGGLRSISTAQAMAHKLRELGLSGSLSAISKAFELYSKAQPPVSARDPNEQTAPENSAEVLAADEAIIAWFESEVRARDNGGPET